MTRVAKVFASPLWIFIVLPLACGLVALTRGQDSNFDLLNYHLHNPGAWLQGRIGRDLAAAGLQSYFNPIIDVPYYVLSQVWPAPLLGFLMGALQGVCGVMVYLIARRVFPRAKRAQTWLAIAGLLTANFWTELGNTMGDNNTAPIVLAGVLCAVIAIERMGANRTGFRVLLLGGLFAGAATGLKLTNAPYAIAIGAAVLVTWQGPWAARIRAAATVAVGAALGFGAVGGYWLWRMWAQFGNPLFPQFGRVFPNPLASAGGISDTTWLPTHWWEYLAWPVIMSVHPLRVGQLHLHSSIWPLFYALAIATGVMWLRRRRGLNREVATVCGGPDLAQTLIVWFAIFGFVLWMVIFSIARYLVAVDLLVPLATWILLSRFRLQGHWRQASIAALALCAAFTLSGPRRIWDHERWANQAFTVTTPVLTDPPSTLILMGSATPQAWMIPFFPASVTFAEIGGAFPQGPAFEGRITSLIKEARHVYVLRDPHPNPWWKDGEASKLAGLHSVGVTFDVTKCLTYRATIGREPVPYQLCPVN